MKAFIQLILLALYLVFSPMLRAEEKDVAAALQGLERINGFEADAELKAIIPAYFALPAHPGDAEIKALFEDKELTQWSSRLADYLGLSDILFDSLAVEDQASNREEFTRCRRILEDFQKEITRYVLGIHPGFSVLGIAPLQSEWSGRGVRILVFDVFDRKRLEQQKLIYPKAQIAKPLVFGRPVELSHGNTVIDIILQLAPHAEIIPLAADAKSYAPAMQYLAEQKDIDIINMSRAFPEDASTHALDAQFKAALRQWTQQGLLVKALGNTGTDLLGQLTRRRLEKGLGPVNTITSYDLKLIRDLYQNSESTGLELFALNLSLFADDVALTATVPGAVLPVQQRTLAVPAEGIFSPSTDTFESGSSFAAPQITAWLALLLEQRRATHPDEALDLSRQAVYEEILQNAKLKGHPAAEWGRGMPSPSLSHSKSSSN